MNSKSCDVIIIGGGPAGLSAGIYTSREMLNTLLLEKGMCGGLLLIADLIENYPGFPGGIKGMELVEKMKEQAQKFGTVIHEFKEIKIIEPSGDSIKVKTDEEEYKTRAVIVASGNVLKKLDIPGEEKYVGRGISYCATCDGPLFKDKDVVVIGGGDASVEEALFLKKFARSVTLVHRRDQLRASKILQDRLHKSEKVRFLLNHVPLSINGEKFVESVTLKDNQTGQIKDIETSGIFIFIGFSPDSKFLEGVVEMDEAGYIITDENMATSVHRIYAAGDVRSKKVRQISVACAEGVIAAMSVRDYLR